MLQYSRATLANIGYWAHDDSVHAERARRLD